MKNLMFEQTSKEVEEVKSEDISKYVEIEDTPFTAINIKGKWMIVMANSIASGRKFDTIEALRGFIKNKPWELIVTAGIIFRDILDENKLKEVKNEK